MPRIAIAIGSNVGDRRAHVEWAFARLREHLADVRASAILETEPVDVPGEQGLFLNAAVTGETAIEPAAVVELLLRLEQERGRDRPFPRAPRTLDLDLILYGDRIVQAPGVEIPHPRFRDRRFVLEPLAEVGGDMPDPVTGLTVRQLLDRLSHNNDGGENRRR